MAVRKIAWIPGEGNSGGGPDRGEICNSGSGCPGVWIDDSAPGTIFVQGDQTPRSAIDLRLGPDRAVVAVPHTLFNSLQVDTSTWARNPWDADELFVQGHDLDPSLLGLEVPSGEGIVAVPNHTLDVWSTAAAGQALELGL